MKAKYATVLAASAIAIGGFAGLAAPASAAPSGEVSVQANCSAQLVTGGEGHRGAKVRCNGLGYFTGFVECKRTDSGFVYRHFGDRVPDGGVSTVWCALNAVVIGSGGIQS
ncbi:hypothetical protein SK854_15855 [Lentzea sp. BCCO 10_0061]|jgi:hypothetical protein|uniref:Secreted protein n=1 Tax=Lentzea sokolovensis TaxID=3095429 RepID=A0ABU4UVW5_9PSEU|nr:hypothetical protein [Lentzea sp. BCCO 10_0061]MDX8143601.1 hypothetical protein [Lentzea sp. BCCO 10_0061]